MIVLRFGKILNFNGLQVCYSVFDEKISSTESPANNMCSKVILKFFYLPKVILKLHLDGKLQVTIVYYLYYKRELSYCQTLWVMKC